MELYAIRYGTASFPLKLVYRDMAGSKGFVKTDWLFYLACNNDKVLLIDTGFRNPLTAMFWRLRFTSAQQELNLLLAGRQVDTVIITHSHFDHINNLGLYPHAQIVIAQEALAQAHRRCPAAVRRVLRKGNVTTVEQEMLLEDTFLFKVIGGHDKGSSVLYFSAGEKDFVLASDECCVCANAWENRPIGSVYNREKNAAFLLDAHKRKLIPLPCHDTAILENYPKQSANIARVI